MSDIGYFKLSRCYQHLSGRGTAPIECLSTRTQLEHRDHQTTETGFSSHTSLRPVATTALRSAGHSGFHNDHDKVFIQRTVWSGETVLSAYTHTGAREYNY